MWYALYMVLAIGGALWQHGDWRFTLALMIVVMPAALLSWVPFRMFPLLYRHILRGVIFLGALFWFANATMNGVPLDRGLIEGLALMGLIFIIGVAPRDYGYMFFISTLLLAYSALFPRVSSLAFTAGATAVLLLLLYRSGNRVFDSGDTNGKEKRRYGTRLRMIVPHLLIAAGISWYVFAAIPIRSDPRPGLFEVSFITQRNSAMPPSLSKWISAGKKNQVQSSPGGSASTRGNSPSSLESEGTPLPIPDPENDDAAMGMDGGGSQGRDLVMRVRSPLKLYHLGMLYNEYDGRTWKVGKRLKSSQLRNDRAGIDRWNHTVRLHYQIEKLVSRRLFSPYVTIYYQAPEHDSRGMPPAEYNIAGGGIVDDRMPEVPFGYTSTVLLMIPRRIPDDVNRELFTALESELNAAGPPPVVNEEEAGGNPRRESNWPETLGVSGYTKLPEKLISERVRKLAGEITAGINAPYDKAIALRDYLRSHYPYELYADPVPEGREATDYFLFELKRGHCEYFASALAVLARCAGLPSRVATGFSPGNYNVLTDTFDVYEYHAHAWTQIYIDDYGWLTFDATPPSAVPSETTPVGIGRFRDPFGDEWRITPPELTSSTLDFIGKRLVALRRRENQQFSALEKALVKVAEAEEKLRKDAEEQAKNKSPNQLDRNADSGGKPSPAAVLRAYLSELLTRYTPPVKRTLFWMGAHWWQLVIAAFLLAGFAWLARVVFRVLRRWWRRRRRLRLLTQAQLSCDDDPARSIRAGYTAMRLALEEAGFPRPPRMELLGYAATLPAENGWRRVAELVCRAFYEAEYAGKPPASTVSVAVLRALEEAGFTVPGRVRLRRRSD